MFAATLSNYPIKVTKYYFPIPGETSFGMIELVSAPSKINQERARTILVDSFIDGYAHLKPHEISEKLTSWRDGENSVQEYYETYFKEELSEFSAGKLHYWVEASVGGKLVGWATFQRESADPKAVYMNLLVVDPAFQKKGIGTQLVNALINLNEISNLNTIHLLLRKKNEGGRKFYTKLGFVSDPEYKRTDNFVDITLLEPFTWKKPALQLKQEEKATSTNDGFESGLSQKNNF